MKRRKCILLGHASKRLLGHANERIDYTVSLKSEERGIAKKREENEIYYGLFKKSLALTRSLKNFYYV